MFFQPTLSPPPLKKNTNEIINEELILIWFQFFCERIVIFKTILEDGLSQVVYLCIFYFPLFFMTSDFDWCLSCQAQGSPLYDVELVDESAGRLHFVKFETRYIEMCLDFIIQQCPALSPSNRSGLAKPHFKATGETFTQHTHTHLYMQGGGLEPSGQSCLMFKSSGGNSRENDRHTHSHSHTLKLGLAHANAK